MGVYGWYNISDEAKRFGGKFILLLGEAVEALNYLLLGMSAYKILHGSLYSISLIML